MAEKEWWEESPEEFANGFTEKVHVHHQGGEQVPAINQNTNAAMAALYGPAAAHSEYSRFSRVRYRDDSKEKEGLIIWICAATTDAPVLYVVEGGGFPDFVSQSDILDALP